MVMTFGKYENLNYKNEIRTRTDRKECLRSSDFYSENDILNCLGLPKKTEIIGSCKILSYEDGLNWEGIMPYVLFIPIPLFIPTGISKDRVFFIEDKMIAHSHDYVEMIYAFGVIQTGHSSQDNFYFGKVNNGTRNIWPKECN
ncbi:hypothetical protein LPTSP4_36580 [Leptospira ryugenii]|uniref:Uncharacterized protein n=2 Tax=Leptospira ryugenii TaxID=1917863 RepID=A0A2P2E5G8_9LEPT|nr:hypothetical protein LPTSP4_36580 [Leptospira ryugenii]